MVTLLLCIADASGGHVQPDWTVPAAAPSICLLQRHEAACAGSPAESPGARCRLPGCLVLGNLGYLRQGYTGRNDHPGNPTKTIPAQPASLRCWELCNHQGLTDCYQMGNSHSQSDRSSPEAGSVASVAQTLDSSRGVPGVANCGKACKAGHNSGFESNVVPTGTPVRSRSSHFGTSVILKRQVFSATAISQHAVMV